jgi:integrase/recombinase XerD
MIHTAVATGLRNSDIRECTIPNTDLKGGFIYIPDPKGGESYRIPLVDKTRHLLRYWINKKRSGWVDNPDNPYIFPSKRGKYLKSNSSFVRIVHDAAKEAGVNEVIGTTADGRSRYKIKPHTLRHAYVTMLDKSDVPEESQVVAVNHSDSSVTETYRHKEKEHHDKIKQRFDPPGEL